MQKLLLILLLSMTTMSNGAQSPKDELKLAEKLKQYFAKYKPKGVKIAQQPHLVEYSLDHNAKTLTVEADEWFAMQEFTPEVTSHIYKRIKNELPKPYQNYELTVKTLGMTIDELIPNRLSGNADKSRLWGNIDYDGEPWVKNVSSPIKITHGLQGRHLSLWASHGRFYDLKQSVWRWQRPKLFGTTEDLFTQTIVVPYLIPMLENAGAVVFTPRERDWQKEEIIVDNDGDHHNYIEVTAREKWLTTSEPGFAMHAGPYADNENPFTAGTARMVKTTTSKSRYALATYQPRFRKEGRYAVYVSYQTQPESIDQVEYTVWHKGERTVFHVNQQMGGGTWVYLGTFDFDAGYSEFNRVTVSNQSNKHGVVTTDAVRFGGGMGNIQREGQTSGMPRALEGARYYAQWAGMPYSVYSGRGGTDDYADDINVRSYMTNYIGGGSPFMPTVDGKKVPIELSLAVHSDAGYARDGEGLIGSLAICTTKFNEGKLNAGISRLASRDLADALLSNVTLDTKAKFGQWNRRELYDRNYSETRMPEVPSAILETMSHQNFPDMRYGQDPNFRFNMARSIYKSILRYVNDQHGTSFVVTPLTPDNFRLELKDDQKVKLSWDAVADTQEATSKPTGYLVYTAIGSSDFDNGTEVKGKTSLTLDIEPGQLYHFKVAAVNRGGRSFTTEVLSALSQPKAKKTILIVNGFHRLSSPAIRNTAEEQGFDINDDPGITYGPTLGWSGRQVNFDRTQMGREGGGLGYSGEELTGMLIAGNDFNYVKTHAEAIQHSTEYNIISCSSKALDNGKVNLKHCAMVDLLLGLERNDGHSLVAYKSFSSSMQQTLRKFTSKGGAMLVSGAYVGTDMTGDEERQFLAGVLKCSFSGRNASQTGNIQGMGTNFSYWNQLNEQHYAATTTDVLRPMKHAFTALQYADGSDAAVAYKGKDYRAFTMGFPFECITDKQKRSAIMQGILNFLLK